MKKKGRKGRKGMVGGEGDDVEWCLVRIEERE